MVAYQSLLDTEAATTYFVTRVYVLRLGWCVGVCVRREKERSEKGPEVEGEKGTNACLGIQSMARFMQPGFGSAAAAAAQQSSRHMCTRFFPFYYGKWEGKSPTLTHIRLRLV